MARKKAEVGGGSAEPFDRTTRLVCLRCFNQPGSEDRRLDDVHDVDIEMDGSTLPYRTRLCRSCREDVKVLFDRGRC